MKDKILYVAGALIIIAAFFIFKNTPATAPTGGTNESPEKIKIDPGISGMTLPLSNDIKDKAWEVFQKYLAFNKSKDIEGVRSVVYKIAPVCEDPKLRIDCEGRMGLAYSYGSVLKKESFTNVWSDGKQIILAGDFKVTKQGDDQSRNRSIIFFLVGDDGSIKMLSFSPFSGATTGTGSASQKEIDDRLIIFTKDTDNDGISDYVEECIPADIKNTCVKTDPKNRDTDGDGYWDGVQALMK